MATMHKRFIDESTVSTIEIFHIVLAPNLHKLRMMTTYGAHIHDHVTIRMPAEDDLLGFQVEPLALVRTVFGEQRRHSADTFFHKKS